MKPSKDNNSDDKLNFSEALSKEFLREMKSKRRWGIFFKTAFLALLVTIVASQFVDLKYSTDDFSGPVVGLIRINGVIGGNVGVSSDSISNSLERAFRNPRLVGLIILINSPGGTPVQSSLINQTIWRYREENPEKKIIAVIEDICASGGYYIASAAQEIYADSSSLVGSIGVRLDSFGFDEAMKKLGIERRLFIAGGKKGLLDPFSPLSDDDKQLTQELLADLHKTFIEAVMKGRKDKLQSSQIFSGLVWSGKQSLELGLIDGLGSYRTVSKKIFSSDNIIDYSEKTFGFQRAFKGFKENIFYMFDQNYRIF
ncbi:MAG: hypothetical protein CBC29_01635 [Methylococcaceae bacterium TMED69]|nr:MAG: hypothetical protein CBC29_01635 [Methylococcaceae bacterium TMED69]